MNITNKNALIRQINNGNDVEYLFFWGHSSSKNKISKSCFSQWFESPFEIDDVKYKTAEHFMMAEKARLFNDYEMEKRILESSTPKEAKQLGRSIKNFNQQVWVEKRFDIVVRANMGKFSQNIKLYNFLKETKDCILVEASPYDNVWGIGLIADDSRAKDPCLWKGLNLLGFALMEVRQNLKTIS